MKAIMMIIVMLFYSCATVRDQMLLGASSGAAFGSGAGYVVGKSQHKPNTGTFVGAVCGALLGSLVGYLWPQKNMAASVDAQTIQESGAQLSLPSVRRMWIPDKIEANTLVKGHFIYVIDKPGVWKLKDEEKQ